MTKTRIVDPVSGLTFDIENYTGPIGPPIDIIGPGGMRPIAIRNDLSTLPYSNVYGLPGCDCPVCANERATGQFKHPPKPTIYECTGCGRKTDDPTKDLKDIRDSGSISCCPDRKMIAQ